MDGYLQNALVWLDLMTTTTCLMRVSLPLEPRRAGNSPWIFHESMMSVVQQMNEYWIRETIL